MDSVVVSSSLLPQTTNKSKEVCIFDRYWERSRIHMETTTSIVQLGGLAAIFLFLWKLHADIAGLSERLARIEGWIQGRFNQDARRAERKGSAQSSLAF